MPFSGSYITMDWSRDHVIPKGEVADLYYWLMVALFPQAFTEFNAEVNETKRHEEEEENQIAKVQVQIRVGALLKRVSKRDTGQVVFVLLISKVRLFMQNHYLVDCV